MSRAEADAPLQHCSAIVSAAILVTSLAGVAAAWLPWHSLVDGMVEVRGIERVEGKVLAGALGVAGVIAGSSLRARRPLFSRTLVAATGTATGAAGVYVYAMAKPESSIHEFVRTALGGTFCPGILLASMASVVAFVLALSCWRHSSRARDTK